MKSGLEQRINESVADFESWYAGLPLAVRFLGRFLGDLICLDLTIYVVALAASGLGLFGLISPNTWSLSTWGYVLATSVAVCLAYEIFVAMRS